MDGTDHIYRDLQRHIDKETYGFPASRSGADIRLLKTFFSPEEAEIVMHVHHEPSTVEEIYESVKHSGISLPTLENMLHSMALRLAVGETERDGTKYYRTSPFAVGMYEGQVNRLTPEFLRDVDEFTSERAFGLAFVGTEVPQMRTIPVEKSLSLERLVMSYDSLADIIGGSEGPFSIEECICRQKEAMQGHPCKVTSRLETCMGLGEMAKLAIENGNGRAISREEALEIARMNEADGLVLQPSNTQKVDYVCACCGCCCGMLGVLKALPKPVDHWATNYHAKVDSQLCTGCGNCLDRCQMEAVSLDDRLAVSHVDLDRCIGCGNCVASCDDGAMTLVRREGEVVPPEDSEELYDIIMANKKGTYGRFKLATKILLKR